MRNSTRRIALASGTAALTVAIASTFVPLAAMAQSSDEAPTDGPAYDALVQTLVTDDQIQGVGVDADNQVVLFTTSDESDLTGKTADVVDSNSNVKVVALKGPIQALSTSDVVGGAGYYATNGASGGLCSIGFTAWSPAGKPAFISAGHCTSDGASTEAYRTKPSTENAAGAADDDLALLNPDLFATLAFAQFGGANDSVGVSGDPRSNDVSAWDVVDPTVKLKPEVTDWTTFASEDLSQSTNTIRSVGEATVGQKITRSGRTTGETTGTVTYAKMSMRIGEPGDYRWVYGFATNAHSDHGDSGGSVYSGSTALGLVSGGGELEDGTSLMFASDLKTALNLTGGYTVMVKINAPTIATSGRIAAGSAITGTARANTDIVITPTGASAENRAAGTVEALAAPATVKSDASGNWSYPAPAEFGDFTFTAMARDGFNKSTATEGAVSIVPGAPSVTAPAVSNIDSVTELSGRATAGGTLDLTGDVTGTATVRPSGIWSIPADLSYGSYTVSATVTVNGVSSATTKYSFDVVPGAPGITSPEHAKAYKASQAPTKAAGTGTDGATITVLLDGQAAGTATVANGKWSVDLADLAEGEHVLSATQTIDGSTSAEAALSFTVSSASVPVAPAKPAPTSTAGGSGLANTGQGDATLPALGGLALLLGGAVSLLIARRTRVAKR